MFFLKTIYMYATQRLKEDIIIGVVQTETKVEVAAEVAAEVVAETVAEAVAEAVAT